MSNSEYYVGVISGTSVDGIDIAVVNFSPTTPQLVAARTLPYNEDLRTDVLSLLHPSPEQEDQLDLLCQLDVRLGQAFAAAVNTTLDQAGISRGSVRAIGLHGQTVRHEPDAPAPYTLQIGDPNTVAARTGLTTVADFRRRDLAEGGQGAPLAPLFHRAVFSKSHRQRAVLNLGGIANVTLLPAEEQSHDSSVVTGWDTGPANCLLDDWATEILHQKCDNSGTWASTGKLNQPLLDQMLSDDYFIQSPPKSTGRSYFCLGWLQRQIEANGIEIPAVDIQRTLVELTAISVAVAFEGKQLDNLIVCGGGVHNTFLMERLAAVMHPCPVASSKEFGVDPDYVEAMAFAYFARLTLAGQPSNLPSVTGATKAVVLGGVYHC